jgi:HTH-type transcriptional repressor of NAD biosynthesis genes
MIKGFVTGSFRPMHKGHEALINYAKSNCDELTILITTLPDEVIPYKYRLKWVLSTYLDDPKVQIIADIIEEPLLKGDALSGWWGMYVKTKYGQFDRVFTSEDYGDVFSKGMGAEHWRFDQERNIIPISATLIRQKPIKYWGYINNFAKDYFVKKIAIVGTESTGKTTLCKKLAEYYNTSWAPEAGRDLIPNSRECTAEDLKLVGAEHAKNIIRAIRHSNKVVFIDTDLQITKDYAEYLFGQTLKFEPWIEKANKVDFYIYLEKDAPYIDDGTRLPKEQRNELDDVHYKNIFLRNNNLKGYIFNPEFEEGESEEEKDMIVNRAYNERFRSIIQDIDKFLSQF